MLERSFISNPLTIDPSDFLIVKIIGIKDEIDFVTYKTKIYEELPIDDINSTVSM